MEHAYKQHLFELLDLVKKELDENPNYRSIHPVTKKVVKQNCDWKQSNDKNIYFVPKPKNF
jgi:hypothetical protein